MAKTEGPFGRPWLRAGIQALLFGFGFSCAACSGDIELGRVRPTPCDFAQSDKEVLPIIVLTFWSVDDREEDPLDELKAAAKAGGLSYNEATDEDRSSLQEKLQQGTSEELPDVFQVNGGSDVLQYTYPDAVAQICSLDRLVELYDVREHYFSSVLDASTCDGSLYAWPLSVHRLNTMLVNVEVYEKVQKRALLEGEELVELNSLKSTAELLELLEKVQGYRLSTESGDPISALSLGIQDVDPVPPNEKVGQEWVLQVAALENILVSYGPAYYERLFQGGGEVTEAQLAAKLQQLAVDFQRMGHLVPEVPRSWQQATQDVGEGRALLTIAGDWVRAQIDPTMLADGRVISIPYPGTRDVFVYTPDSFAVPRQVISDGAAARRWFSAVVDDLDTQLAFAREKQAIPARSKLTRQDLRVLNSDYLQASYQQFSECHEPGGDGRLLLAVSGLAPSPHVDPCFDRLGRVLAVIAGMPYVGQEEGGSSACPRDMPEGVEDATSEMVKILMDLSRTPFRKECRSWSSQAP